MDLKIDMPNYQPPERLLSSAVATEFPLIFLNKSVNFVPGLPLVVLHLGPSGSGKDATTEQVFQDGVFVHAVTATSRSRRIEEDEPENKYIWMRKRRVDENAEDYDANLVREYDLIEYDRHFGELYGLPRQSVYDAAIKGIPLIRTEPRGANTVMSGLRDEFNFVVTFVVPESFEILLERISRRGNVEERFAKAIEEIDEAPDVTNYYLFNPVEYEGLPGLPLVQKSFEMLILSLEASIDKKWYTF